MIVLSANDFFEKLKERFLQMKDVKKQGNSLKFKKKMFVMLSKGNFVVKLPAERVSELVTTGKGLPYDPGNGKFMKEWVIIPIENSKKWEEFSLEAKNFVSTLFK